MNCRRRLPSCKEHNVTGVQKFRMRFKALDEKGEPMALWDTAGKPIEKIQIPDEPAAPPYRE